MHKSSHKWQYHSNIISVNFVKDVSVNISVYKNPYQLLSNEFFPLRIHRSRCRLGLRPKSHCQWDLPVGLHFGFLPITAYAHTSDRDTPPILLQLSPILPSQLKGIASPRRPGGDGIGGEGITGRRGFRQERKRRKRGA